MKSTVTPKHGRGPGPPLFFSGDVLKTKGQRSGEAESSVMKRSIVDLLGTIAEPDVIEDLLRIIAAPEVMEDLRLAHRTNGRAFVEGRIRTAEAREVILDSTDCVDEFPGSAWLVRRRVRHIGRWIGASVPVPLWAPRVVRGPDITALVGVVRDSCSWLAIPAWAADPDNEFDGPFPIASELDTESVLSLTGLTYSCLSRARRTDPTLMLCLRKIRGEFRYESRGLYRWLAESRKLA